MTPGQSHIVVCALYKFVTLERFQDLRQPLLKVMEYNNIRGTLLLASEGPPPPFLTLRGYFERPSLQIDRIYQAKNLGLLCYD